MKLLTIQDISCLGQCSITVALPILSHYGIETAILPSAILSTHTSGFKNFTVHDLTGEMPKIIEHWIKEKIQYDAIYTGYIGNAKQFDYVLECKEKLLNSNGLLFVDPAMADHGKLYPGLGEDIIEGMKSIVAIADYILPNITEACFLTGIPYQEEQTEEFIDKLLIQLIALGAKNVILTGVIRQGQIGATYFNGKERITILKDIVPQNYHGTGDIFSSVIIANILNQKSIHEALDIATDFICHAIKQTMPDKSHDYGVKFEEILYKQKGAVKKKII